MSNFGQQIILKQLLEDHGRVQVPMVQRDYAQGRESEAEVREEFLGALHRALSLPADDGALPLNLDFIYGSVEGNVTTSFLPLDGQQRLTTLFLLHWYLAWRDDCWQSFEDLFCIDSRSRFSYGVRPSSTEFFDALVLFRPEVSPDSVEAVGGLVANQPWHFRYWRLDSTIQSSLRMLDAIHVRFRESSGYFSRIIDTKRPAITFQLLNLENFGLSDDLYIKMNARGKPLTAFETFKARYEQDLEKQYAGEFLPIGNESFPVAEYFSRRMDTAWADFFWTHRNSETNLFDGAAMNLFRAIALITRDPESDNYVDDIVSLRDGNIKTSYAVFHRNGRLDRNFSEALILLLDTWSKDGAEFATQLPDSTHFDEAAVFEDAIRKPADFEYVRIVQFVGYVVFLRESSNALQPAPGAFQEWMRIVCNLSNNTDYGRPSDLQRSVSGILGMASQSGDILAFFASADRPTPGFYLKQVSEEKLKAELILADGGWRARIDRAEMHGYFKGQIEFLLDFCGVLEERNGNDVIDWEPEIHNSLQARFDSYFAKAELMFDARGLNDLGNHRWERALLCMGDYLLPYGQQSVSFLVNTPSFPDSWKRLLRGSDQTASMKRKLLEELFDRISEADTLGAQLDQIINGARAVEPWRQALIETPQAIEYCKYRLIRKNTKVGVYLLKKTRMNGAHAELVTYCLFHNELLPIAEDVGFAPLSLVDEYYSSNNSYIEPGIQFRWSTADHSLTFDLEWNGKKFKILVRCDSLEELPDVRNSLRDSARFSEFDDFLIRKCSRPKLLETVDELRQALVPFSSVDAKDD